MQRSRFSRLTIFSLFALTVLVLAAGCSHHAQNAAAPPTPASQAVAPQVAAAPGPAQGGDFQPYTLLPKPPPTPPVVTRRHRVLHLTHFHNRVYLADSDRHLYEAGRDAQGHVYPVYRDPATHAAYPLYYDGRRDTLYRLAQNDDGRFYRNYVGQPADQYSPTDPDYERVEPTNDDRPVVTDSDNTYNYNTYNNDSGNAQNSPVYPDYPPPPAHHSSGFNNNWLWAIPVVIGAYLLLHPHHHATPPRPAAPATVIVRQTTPVTIINQNNINPVNPPPYRPVFHPSAPTAYRPVYTPPSLPRPSYPVGPFAARRAAPAVQPLRVTALTRPLAAPAPRPLPRPVVSSPSVQSRPIFQRVPVAARPVPPTVFRRPVAVSMPRPFVRPPMPAAAPRPVPVAHVPEPSPVITPPIVRAQPIVHPRPVAAEIREAPRHIAAPRREPVRPEPRVERPVAPPPAPEVRPAVVAPRREEPTHIEPAAPREEVREERPVTPEKPREEPKPEPKEADKKEAKPKKEARPKDASRSEDR